MDQAAGQPTIRRALGPALDGRLALQRLVRPSAVPDVLNSYAQIWRAGVIGSCVRSMKTRGTTAMVREMLAADELAPGDDANVVATGFLVRNFYRWNYNTWMKDNVEHTGKAFLGLTFNCCPLPRPQYDPDHA